jgi:hypothetical protein
VGVLHPGTVKLSYGPLRLLGGERIARRCKRPFAAPAFRLVHSSTVVQAERIGASAGTSFVRRHPAE